jgi:hypothetical protein
MNAVISEIPGLHPGNEEARDFNECIWVNDAINVIFVVIFD